MIVSLSTRLVVQPRLYPTSFDRLQHFYGVLFRRMLSHVGQSLWVFLEGRKLRQGDGCCLVVDYRYPFCLCVYVYIWRDVRLGPDHRIYWRGRGRISFWGAVGSVGDGETGSVSLYKGNLNKLSVLFFRPPPTAPQPRNGESQFHRCWTCPVV
jgi:hypothetical protein